MVSDGQNIDPEELEGTGIVYLQLRSGCQGAGAADAYEVHSDLRVDDASAGHVTVHCKLTNSLSAVTNDAKVPC